MNERDAETVRREDARAIAGGLITGGYRAGSADGHRAMIQAPNRRRKCCCGCGGRLTHVGLGDGMSMLGGCEWIIRRWVREGYSPEIVAAFNRAGDRERGAR